MVPRRRAEADADDAAAAVATAAAVTDGAATARSTTEAPTLTTTPPPAWFARLSVTGGLRVPDEGAVLAAVNAELAAAGRPPWRGAVPPAPNAVLPSDHVPLVVGLAVDSRRY